MEDLHIKIHEQSVEIDLLTAENERLRALVKEAYEEGWDSARYGSRTDDDDWLTSSTRAALQPKEEIK